MKKTELTGGMELRDEAIEPAYAVTQTDGSWWLRFSRHNAQRTGTECYANLKAI